MHAPSAFPLALVAVEISTNVVEFPSVLMSALIKKCCFAVPRYPKNSTNTEAFKIELGYLTVDGVVKESDTAFFERMSGLISFYAAIVQTTSLSGNYLVKVAFNNYFRKTKRSWYEFGLDLACNNVKSSASFNHPISIGILFGTSLICSIQEVWCEFREINQVYC